MHRSFAAALGFWQALALANPVPNPVRVLPRQDVTTTTSSSSQVASASEGATVSSSDLSVTATVFQANQEYVLNAAAPTPPSSGCQIYTQEATTYATIQTVPGGETESANVGLTAGLYCTCADNTAIIQVATSYNPHGTAFMYCADHKPTGTSDFLSTQAPQASADPGSPLNPDWADVACDAGDLDNESGTQSPWQMWNDTGAEAAWNDMTTSWDIDKDSPGQQYSHLSDYALNYYHGPQLTHCWALDESNCGTPAQCGQWQFANAPIEAPAPYFIFTEMVAIHQIMQLFSSGLDKAISQVGLLSDDWVQNFSPLPAELAAIQKEKLTLDIILIIVGVVAVALFELVIPLLPIVGATVAGAEAGAVASSVYSTVKTELYVNTGASLGLVKDKMTSPTITAAEAEVGDYIASMTNSLSGAAGALTQSIFDTPDILFGLVDKGKMWAPGTDFNETSWDISQTMQRLIFANTLPTVWSTGTIAKTAFITTGTGTAGDSVSGCDGYDPSTAMVNGLLSQHHPVLPSDASDTEGFFQSVFYCINNVPYWLMVGWIDDEYFSQLTVEAPSGLDKLDGTAYGGITITDVISSAVNTWSANGKMNNGGTQDPTSLDTLQTWEKGNLPDIHGIVPIPVCSFQEAGDTAVADPHNEAQNPNWPCPADGVVG